jgi:crotonobetainyl-CoA:carnitine CoA-transferase CaiB-like acyl-CoA transferase
LATDPRYATNSARVAHRAELKTALEALLSAQGADAWQEAITAAGVPCGPINDVAQGFALAERLGLEPIVTVGHGAETQPGIRNPVTYSRSP